MKLNNKGITTIEILISFVLLAIIVVSLYGTVESYKNKQNIESEKNQIMTYKNLLTKEIQDDLIMKGLIDVTVKHQPFVAVPIIPETYTVDFSFKDGTKSQLIVKRVLANDYEGNEGSVTSNSCTEEKNDYFSISYGPEGDLTEYELPDLGSGKNKEGCKVLDLRMSDININTDNDILTIDIRFYHPDFSTKYGIDIACPINFFR